MPLAASLFFCAISFAGGFAVAWTICRYRAEQARSSLEVNLADRIQEHYETYLDLERRVQSLNEHLDHNSAHSASVIAKEDEQIQHLSEELVSAPDEGMDPLGETAQRLLRAQDEKATEIDRRSHQVEGLKHEIEDLRHEHRAALQVVEGDRSELQSTDGSNGQAEDPEPVAARVQESENLVQELESRCEQAEIQLAVERAALAADRASLAVSVALDEAQRSRETQDLP